VFQDCTDTLLDQLDQQLKITEEEGKDYRCIVCLDTLKFETQHYHAIVVGDIL
jgi:beclin 1